MDELRPDVLAFALEMNRIMNEKEVERVKNNLPLYSEVGPRDLVYAMDDQNEQVIASYLTLNPKRDTNLVSKHLIHIANYAMMLYIRLNPKIVI